MLGTFPLALGILASPIAVIPAVLLLLGDRPRVSAPSFLLGWSGGLAVLTGGAILFADFVIVAEGTPTWLSWIRVVVGGLLILYGLLTWLRRGGSKEPPQWLTGIQQMPPRKAAALGALLSAGNPKVILLALTAGLTIGTAQATPVEELVAFLLFMLIGSVEILIPLGAFLIAGERAAAPLERGGRWLEENGTPVMVVVVMVIGALLLFNGLRAL